MTNYISLKAGLFKFLLAQGITTYVYYRELPQNPSYPATVYTMTDDYTADEHQQGPGLRRAVLQVDVLAESVAEVEEAAEKYYALLAGYRGTLSVPGFTSVSIRDEGANLDTAFFNESLNKKIEIRGRSFEVTYK